MSLAKADQAGKRDYPSTSMHRYALSQTIVAPQPPSPGPANSKRATRASRFKIVWTVVRKVPIPLYG